jgi:alpha-glucosidase
VRIQAGDRISYSILLNGKPLLQDSSLSIRIDQRTLGLDPKVKAAKERSVNQEIEPQVRQKFARIRENYNELRLDYLRR